MFEQHLLALVILIIRTKLDTILVQVKLLDVKLVHHLVHQKDFKTFNKNNDWIWCFGTLM